jgi:adenine C2-methylase RlmN of 23S rRNA A2503 and tRNA A37
MKAAKEFESSLKRGERFTFEYVRLGGDNDTDEHAVELANLLGPLPIKKGQSKSESPTTAAEQLDYTALNTRAG